MQRMLMQIKQSTFEVVDEMTLVASRPYESCAVQLDRGGAAA